jgi:hypothetical protein
MAIRLKSQWHNEDAERSLEEIGGAAAFNIWRIAMDKALNLHGESFVYDDDRQRLAVIGEYLIFLALIVERMTHERLNNDERRTLITALALRLADHLAENSRELLGEGDYRSPFVELFNQRAAAYSELHFTDEGPSYPFLRQLGADIQQIMGSSHENRWVIDQVMDKDGPEAYSQLKRVVKNLFL